MEISKTLPNLLATKKMETIVQKLNPLKHFRLDTVLIDNPIFKLHHQVNFFLVFFGAVFIYGTNYLDKDAIVCLNGGVRALVSKVMMSISIMICRTLLVSIVGFMAAGIFLMTCPRRFQVRNVGLTRSAQTRILRESPTTTSGYHSSSPCSLPSSRCLGHSGRQSREDL